MDYIVAKYFYAEQMEIIKQREGNEDRLTWGEIQNMKYTWRVAQELMRMIPPLFGAFRKTIEDTNYEGYDIPKGWQVGDVSSKVLNRSHDILYYWTIVLQCIMSPSHLRSYCGYINNLDVAVQIAVTYLFYWHIFLA